MTDELTNELASGDLVVTPHAVPFIDAIVEDDGENLHFRSDQLLELLRFLESIVLYDRLVVPQCEIHSSLSQAEQELIERWTGAVIIGVNAPALNLREHVIERLQSAQALVTITTRLSDITLRDHFEKHLLISPSLNDRIQRLETYMAEENYSAGLRREMARVVSCIEIGRPLYWLEVTRRSSVPLQLGSIDESHVADIEHEERQAATSIIRELSSGLNASAASQLRRLEAMGVSTTFAATPIAWQILSRATTPPELVDAALAMRAEFSNFRKYARQMDQELRDDAVSMLRKSRIIGEIEAAIRDLCGSEQRGFRQRVIESTSLVAAIPFTQSPTPGAVAGLAKALLGQPLERILEIIRHRRYRVLFKARREFMGSKHVAGKIAALFSLPIEAVRRQR